MCQVLACFLENKLFLKAKKCEFHVDTVSCQGLAIWYRRVRAALKKVQQWRCGMYLSKQELQSFLVFANYV